MPREFVRVIKSMAERVRAKMSKRESERERERDRDRDRAGLSPPDPTGSRETLILGWLTAKHFPGVREFAGLPSCNILHFIQQVSIKQLLLAGVWREVRKYELANQANNWDRPAAFGN